MNASATTGGHFVSEAQHTLVDPFNEGTSTFVVDGVHHVCEKTEYPATASTPTATEVTIAPVIEGCTIVESSTALFIHLNGCTVTVKIGKKAAEENTVQLNCPAGKQVELTSPSCTLRVPPQAVGGGLRYTTITANEKHALTIDVNVNFTAHREAGLCVFTGTKASASLIESLTAYGQSTEGSYVGITATGSEG